MQTLKFRFVFVIVALFLLSSCNSDEGYGGSASIEGRVFQVFHDADNFAIDKDGKYSIETNIVPARDADIYIVFGSDSYYGEREKTGDDGQYLFRYLNAGEYTVYAFSKKPDGEKIAEKKTVHVKKGGKAVVEDIYVHEGKAYGTSVIVGNLFVKYYDKGYLRGTFPAAGYRIYIKNVVREEIKDGKPVVYSDYFDDIRAADDGTFIFQKLQPGKYIVYVPSENDVKNFEEVIVSKTVDVKEADKVYDIRMPEQEDNIVFVKNL